VRKFSVGHPIFISRSKVNPLRFSNLTQAILPKKQHGETISLIYLFFVKSSLDAGEIWANMLHNVYAALVKKYGFSKSARTNPNGKEGNVVFLHLMLDALAIQPCNPQCETIPIWFGLRS
jgi:hypothetical protein